MKAIQNITKPARMAYQHLMLRATLGYIALMTASSSFAITATDMSQDVSNGRTVDNIAENVVHVTQTGTSLGIQITAVIGWILVAVCLYQLYKASKDEREKPTSAIVGFCVGGAMAAVGTVLWAFKNSIIGA